MKMTVIGAGAIGSAVARELDARSEVTQLQVCDARARSLQELHQNLKSPKLRPFQLDARDPAAVGPVIQDSACVIGASVPQLNPALSKICLSLGIHFCDLGGSEIFAAQQLQLDEEARRKSVWIIPNCGLAPGLINILCMRGIEAFDEVEAAHLRVGDVPVRPDPPFNFRISWSADKVIDDYTQPVRLIRDGSVLETDSLSNEEVIFFPEPFEEMEAFCTAGSLATLIDDLDGRIRTLDHKTIRWPGHVDQMRFLLGLGFGETLTIDPRTHLTYRDVLVRRLQQRLGGSHDDAVLLRVLILGIKDGRPHSLVYEMVDFYDEETDLTAMKRCTSISTATIACLVASGKLEGGGGAAPPERVIPKEEYCRILTARGLNIQEGWHDGHLDVSKRPLA